MIDGKIWLLFILCFHQYSLNNNFMDFVVKMIHEIKFLWKCNFLKQIILMNHCLQIYIFLNLWYLLNPWKIDVLEYWWNYSTSFLGRCDNMWKTLGLIFIPSTGVESFWRWKLSWLSSGCQDNSGQRGERVPTHQKYQWQTHQEPRGKGQGQS